MRGGALAPGTVRQWLARHAGDWAPAGPGGYPSAARWGPLWPSPPPTAKAPPRSDADAGDDAALAAWLRIQLNPKLHEARRPFMTWRVVVGQQEGVTSRHRTGGLPGAAGAAQLHLSGCASYLRRELRAPGLPQQQPFTARWHYGRRDHSSDDPAGAGGHRDWPTRWTRAYRLTALLGRWGWVQRWVGRRHRRRPAMAEPSCKAG